MGVEGILHFFNIFCPFLLFLNGVIMIYTAILESKQEKESKENPKDSQRCQEASDVRRVWEELNIN